MTMKTYIYLFIILLCTTACSDFLDETPKGNLIPKTVDDFAMMLDSYSSDQIAYGNPLTEMMNDDVKIPDAKISRYYNWGIRSFCWEDYVYTESENDATYNALYHVIYVCNYILDNIENAEEKGEFSREYVEGAARFHRANAYFNLVNLYSKHYDAKTATTDLGVALLLKADVNAQPNRASVHDVYEAINKDLTKAEKLLDNTPVEYTFRASKAAVYAMMARVHLYREEYEECREACRKARAIAIELIDYNNLSKDKENPDGGISGSEGTASIPSQDWRKPEIICYKWVGTEPNRYTDYNLSDELIRLFDEETDLRWKLFVTTCNYEGDGTPGTDEPRISAFMYNANKGYNIGEVYITEAEACVRTNDIDGALWALNALSVKRYETDTYKEISERNADKLLRIILDERRREQMFKGTRWFDLKRLNKDPRFAKTIIHVYQGETYTLEPNDNHYVIAIPPKAIAANNRLEQNPR